MNALSRMPQRSWDLLGDFDHVVNGFFDPVRATTSRNATTSTLLPPLDIVETTTAYEILVDLPGVNKEDLNVSVKEDVLSIEANTVNSSEVKEGETVIKSERRTGKYLRTLRLGKAVDESKIAAEYANGVLKLTLPKAEEAVSRKITVDVH